MSKITNTSYDLRLDWLFGRNPGAIENQEMEGQTELAHSSQLPVICKYPYNMTARDQYEKLGIEIIGATEGDGYFMEVKMPKGWKIEATDHSMWSNLLDHSGAIRASIFYKAAFYDRSAHINFHSRYETRSRFSKEVPGQFYQFAIDLKTGEEIFRTEDENGYHTMEENSKAIQLYLDNNYPEFRDINAYWED